MAWHVFSKADTATKNLYNHSHLLGYTDKFTFSLIPPKPAPLHHSFTAGPLLLHLGPFKIIVIALFVFVQTMATASRCDVMSCNFVVLVGGDWFLLSGS